MTEPSPADLGARIAALEAELAEKTAALAGVETALATAEATIASQRTEYAAELLALHRQMAAAAEQGAAQLAAARLAAADAHAACEKAKADRAALAAKWDALRGPVEDGIVLGPQPYITTADDKAHPTLEAARTHKKALAWGLSDSQAAAVIANP